MIKFHRLNRERDPTDVSVIDPTQLQEATGFGVDTGAWLLPSALPGSCWL